MSSNHEQDQARPGVHNHATNQRHERQRRPSDLDPLVSQNNERNKGGAPLLDAPAYLSPNPYNDLILTRPNRLSVTSYQKFEIPKLKTSFIVQIVCGVLSVICSALYTPFGAHHSDIIHTVTFMFGLACIATGVITGLFMFRCPDNGYSKLVCCFVNSCDVLLTLAAVILSLLSMLELFDGKGAEARVVLSETHYTLATHLLTAIFMFIAIIQMIPAAYIAYKIISFWRSGVNRRPILAVV